MRHLAIGALGLFVGAALTGCGDGHGAVVGTVTLDGQPVANGSITFVKTDGGLTREGAVIKDGKFQARIPPGTYRVELYAQKVVGKKRQKGFSGEDEVIELTEEMFPERYNTKTELTQEIKAGANTIKLDLKSTK